MRPASKQVHGEPAPADAIARRNVDFPRMRFLFVLVLASACVHTSRLFPAADAQRAAGDPGAAVASAAGVKVWVDPQRWRGEPSTLESLVTPLHVILENTSQVPILVRYRDFSLLGADGLMTSAIPPFQIQRPGQSGSVAPAYGLRGFALLGPYGPFYPGMQLWGGPFDWDPGFYDQAYQWDPSLPTPDMLRQALPEGVLQPGGRAEGFLYFHRLRQGSGEVKFTEDVFAAESNQRVATLRIPLAVR